MIVPIITSLARERKWSGHRTLGELGKYGNIDSIRQATGIPKPNL